jgi:hypothetical protein
LNLVPVFDVFLGNGTLLLSILYPTKPKYRRTTPRHSPRHFTGIDYSDLSIELSSRVEGLRRRRWERRIRNDERRKEAGEELGVNSDSDSEEELEDEDDEEDDDNDEEEEDGSGTAAIPSHDKDENANNPPGVTWFASDLLTSTLQTLHSQSSSVPLNGWDLVLDKGTYDAIALSQEPVQSGPESSRGKLPSAVYPERVAGLVKPGGFFLITCKPSDISSVRGIAAKSRFSYEQLVISPKTRSRRGSLEKD